MAAVEHQEKLTRTELAEKRKEALREARIAVADRLKREREEYGQDIAPWMTIERSNLEVRLARDIGAAIGEAVGAGLDTDCNGATVGGMWGIQGDAIPARWTQPWQGRVALSLAGHAELPLETLVQRTTRVAECLAGDGSD